MAMATGEAPAEVATTELPEVFKTVQETVRILPLISCCICFCFVLFFFSFSCYYTVFCYLQHEYVIGFQWDKVEDKYAVSSLAVAGVVALWGSTGMISVRFLKCRIISTDQT